MVLPFFRQFFVADVLVSFLSKPVFLDVFGEIRHLRMKPAQLFGREIEIETTDPLLRQFGQSCY